VMAAIRRAAPFVIGSAVVLVSTVVLMTIFTALPIMVLVAGGTWLHGAGVSPWIIGALVLVLFPLVFWVNLIGADLWARFRVFMTAPEGETDGR